MNKYRIYCTTDSKMEYVIASAEPTECPTNAAHTVSSDSICIIQKDVKVNDGTPTDLTLSDYKQLRYNEIDGKTMALIAPGFTYDGKQFSLSIPAQNNWSGLHDNSADFIFPYDITTIDNDTYSLTSANLNAFWTAAKDVLEDKLGTGRALKKQIFDAADEAAVDAVVDNR